METSNNQNLNDLKTVIGYYGENALLLTQMGLKYPTRINEKVIKYSDKLREIAFSDTKKTNKGSKKHDK